VTLRKYWLPVSLFTRVLKCAKIPLSAFIRKLKTKSMQTAWVLLLHVFTWMKLTRALTYGHYPLSLRYSLISCRMNSDQTTDQYQTLSSASPYYSAEMEVKKSRFIGFACHVDSWSEAQLRIEAIKKEHPKARHWCYAFCTGVNPVNERCSDDGEPTGTAGAPILNAIRSEGLSDTICVIVRYFGGIKLGAGGLIRAYGNAARQVLRESPRTILIPKSTFTVEVSTSYIGSLYDVVSKFDGVCADEVYDTKGNVKATIMCDTSNEKVLQSTILDSTRGTALFFVS
jgi:uncharacterized YigZ family protein